VQGKGSKLKIPDTVADILKAAGAIGDKYGFKVFAVGGFVRDLLLGADNLDIDIAVEGDGLRFAKELANKLNGSLITHKQFGTATIASIARVDIATARSESYKVPAAYPNVKFGTIKDDLKRRDFTINAIALSLNKKSFKKIVDFFNGRKDLKRGIIRVLHDQSFIDDPTRIFRAVRFEQRYGFRIEARTEQLLRHAVNSGVLHKLKKQRIERERAIISKEKKASRMFARLEGFSGEKECRA